MLAKQFDMDVRRKIGIVIFAVFLSLVGGKERKDFLRCGDGDVGLIMVVEEIR